MPPPLVIADYDPDWPRLFEREAAAVCRAAPAVLRVEHVGSTAVPGLSARPTIDLLAGVEAVERLDAGPLAALGYVEDAPEAHAAPGPGRRFFWKGTPAFPTFHLHAVPLDGPLWGRFLAFRARLRADLDLAERYDHLKRRLALEPRADAASARAAFIDAALQA